MPRVYTVEKDLKPFIGPWGKEKELPNWKPMELQQLCWMLVGAGGIALYPGHPGLKVPENDYRTRYGRLFLSRGQLGGWDGTGYAMVDKGYGNPVITGSWAICEHEKHETAGADPQHGWSPGYCVKCGLDMTVDSGD